MRSLWLMLAQEGTPATPQQQGPPSGLMLLGIILPILVFYFILFRGRNKERQRYEDMLKSLKRNDRVQTIGGIFGTVVDVRDNEVVLKVDETNNVKMRFNRTAIKEVIREAVEEK